MSNIHKNFYRQVADKEKRKLSLQKSQPPNVWFGLGTFGLVGWAVAVPAFLGAVLGFWIDAHWPSRYSWTLMLLLFGVGLGCANAWYWVDRERKSIHAEREKRLK